VAIELSGVQFWSEIILVISNRTRATRSFDFEIPLMISYQIALHSVQLPLYIKMSFTWLENHLELLCHYVAVVFQMKDSCSANLTFRAHN